VADESSDLYKIDKIREYARDGYAPFCFKKGLMEPWNPSDRWECPPYTAMKDSPEADMIVCLAKQVDEIEWSGNTNNKWTASGVSNPFRDRIIDETCLHFFGNKRSDRLGHQA
ncbi:MAG: hypothetical protein ACKPKO_04680, partial [Candidatus Fonsibacter sp.]